MYNRAKPSLIMISDQDLNNLILRDITFKNLRSERIHSDKEALYEDPYYRFKRILLTLENNLGILPSDDDVWVDLGCHGGEFLSLIVNKYRIKCIGVDQWNLKSAIDWLDIEYHNCDLSNDWTLRLDQEYDFISALEVIEHVIDTDQFLRRCYSRLTKNGILLLSTPNVNSLRNRVAVPFGAYPFGLEYKNDIHHVRLYNVPTIRSHLRENGFRILGVVGVSFLPIRFIKNRLLRGISDRLAERFPQLCNEVIVIAKRKRLVELAPEKRIS